MKESINIGVEDTLMVSVNHYMETVAESSNNVWWAILSVVLLVVLFIILYWKRKFIYSNIKWIAAGVFLAGAVLYGIGFNDAGCKEVYGTLVSRSVVSSLEMFVSHSDLLEVREEMHECKVYMLIFSLVHLMAVLVSAVIIVRLFGLKVLSYLRMIWCRVFKKATDIHVFFGVNENTMILAESVYEKADKKDMMMVFINVKSKINSSGIHRTSFSHFFHSDNEDFVKYFNEIEKYNGCLFDVNENLIQSVNVDKKKFFKSLGIHCLDKLIERSIWKKKIRYYFLSDNEKLNFAGVMALSDISYLDNNNFICFCHARGGNDNLFNQMLFESNNLKSHIHLVDSSLLSVMMLKKEYKYHPVNYVTCNTESGTVSTPFVGMVIGFGETGRDAFRFMYEYGSFIESVKWGENGEEDYVVEQKKELYVVDGGLKSLKSDFLSTARALEGDNSIVWLDTPTDSFEFDKTLENIINRLNYVVISLGDDDENSNLAVKIYNMASVVYSREKGEGGKLGIFVRIRNKKNKGKFDSIKEYLERSNPDSGVSINIFGDNESVFKYDNIDNGDVKKQAKRFYYEYNNVRKMNVWEEVRSVKKEMKGKELDEKLEKLYSELDDVNKEYSEKVADTLWDKREKGDPKEWRYKEEQDYSNAYHIYTKRALAGFVGEKQTDDNRKEIINEKIKLIDTLGYCEHSRWNAKMYLMNFVLGEKDVKRLKHDCLVSCNDLIRGENKKTIFYDKRTVDVSFDKIYDL